MIEDGCFYENICNKRQLIAMNDDCYEKSDCIVFVENE